MLSDRDFNHNGVLDDFDFANPTDPTHPDTDSDGLGDAAEFATGTNPRHPDTDGDSLIDSTEVPGPTDPSWEPDLDGRQFTGGEAALYSTAGKA